MYNPIDLRTIRPSKKETFYINKFLGVDYTSGDLITDYHRSPDALNLTWGNNPYQIETRAGTKRILNSKIMDGSNEAVIYGIHTLGSDILVHAGSNLYQLSGDMDELDYTVVMTDLAERKSKSFTMNGKLYIIGAGTYIVFDGSTNEVEGFIPTTVIGRHPDGGGTPFEPINLLSTRRKNSFYADTEKTEITDSFVGDGEETVFTLSENKITTKDFIVTLNDIEQTLNEDYTVNRVDKAITFTEAPALDVDINVIYEADTGNWITDYQLDSTDIDYTAVVCTVDGVVMADGEDYEVNRETGVVTFNTAPQGTGVDTVVIEFSKSNGDTIKIEQTLEGDGETVEFVLNTIYPITNETITVEIESTAEEDFTVDRVSKTITFDEAPANESEIIITFNVIKDTRADVIKNCTIFNVFGGKNDTRVFLSGNSDYPNRDWASGLYDATYFPDTGYTDIGNDSIKIMGYVKQYDTQMIVKEGNQQDGSAFLRTFALDNESKPIFPVEQGAVGIGAISQDCFAYIQGEPLFLSSQGVVGVVGTNVDYHRLIQDKSNNINSELLKEDLTKAFAVEYKNKYHLFINGKVYLCDARMRYEDALSVQYEWYNWDNINATCATVYGDYLLFGFAGMVFRFRKKGELGYFKDEDYDGNERTIKSYWATPKLFLKSISQQKSLDAVYFMFGSNTKLKVNIKCTVDDDREIDLGSYERLKAINFVDDLDFGDDISFKGSSTNAEKANAFIRKFDNIKFKIENVDENSGIGLEMIQVVYSFTGG